MRETVRNKLLPNSFHTKLFLFSLITNNKLWSIAVIKKAEE